MLIQDIIDDLSLDYEHLDHLSALSVVKNLLSVIKDVHSQQGDDICWMDIDQIFVAAGLPVPDRKIGNPTLMHANCAVFIETMCSNGGPWRSYREILNENITLKDQLAKPEERIKNQVAANNFLRIRLKAREDEIKHLREALEYLDKEIWGNDEPRTETTWVERHAVLQAALNHR